MYPNNSGKQVSGIVQQGDFQKAIMTLIKSRNIWRACLGELEKRNEHAEQQITLGRSL